MMPDRYDLLRVNFIDTSGADFPAIGLCYAPPYEIAVGDTVETAIG